MNSGYNQPMPRPVIHISEAEAASDFAGVLARVRAGMEVIIEHDARPVAVVHPAEPLRGRPISESIALARRTKKKAERCRFSIRTSPPI